ncbi:MAG: fibronectin type III domain-containing protein, partial [Lachnospiraceae bacterium]|nr:fibronectin type III domain-containing protein [Lachnospiraceae bacterium]
GRVSLSWDAVNNADGYQIWMSDSANGTYTIAKSIEDGNTTSYAKSGLNSGSTAYFKVRAYVQDGDKKTFGAYSETVSAAVK